MLIVHIPHKQILFFLILVFVSVGLRVVPSSPLHSDSLVAPSSPFPSDSLVAPSSPFPSDSLVAPSSPFPSDSLKIFIE
jgi:hypothetical protein